MYRFTVSQPILLNKPFPTHFSASMADLQSSEVADRLPVAVAQSAPDVPALFLPTPAQLPAPAGNAPLQVAANTALPAVNTPSAAGISTPQIGLVTMLVKGPVIAQNGDLVRPLYKGAAIYLNDTIMTSAGSYVKITLQDGTLFQLGPESRATLELFVLHQDSSTHGSEFTASVHKGLFSFTQNSSTEDNHSLHLIKTPVAHLNLYNSEIEGRVESDGSTTLLHRTGFVDITTVHQSDSLQPSQAGLVLSISATQATIQIAPPATEVVFREQVSALHTMTNQPAPLTSTATEASQTTEVVKAMPVAEVASIPTAPAHTEAAQQSRDATQSAPATSPVVASANHSTENPATAQVSVSTPVATAVVSAPVVQPVRPTTSSQANNTSSAQQTPSNATPSDKTSGQQVALLDTDSTLLTEQQPTAHRRTLLPSSHDSEPQPSTPVDTATEAGTASLSNAHAQQSDASASNSTATPTGDEMVRIGVNQPLSVPLSLLLPDHDSLDIKVGNGQHGQVLSQDGYILFVPDQDFVGAANFEYELNLNGETTRGLITIRVEPTASDSESSHFQPSTEQSGAENTQIAPEPTIQSSDPVEPAPMTPPAADGGLPVTPAETGEAPAAVPNVTPNPEPEPSPAELPDSSATESALPAVARVDTDTSASEAASDTTATTTQTAETLTLASVLSDSDESTLFSTPTTTQTPASSTTDNAPPDFGYVAPLNTDALLTPAPVTDLAI